MTTPAKRFVVASAYFPPFVGGTSTVMSNLLSRFRSDCFSVVADDPSCFPGEVHNRTVPPGIRVVRLPLPTLLRRVPFSSFWLPFFQALRISFVQRTICAEARRLQAERIITVFPSLSYMIAAHKAALRLRVPLVTYHMDAPYPARLLRGMDGPLTRRWEKAILRASAARLVLSDAVAECIRCQSGLDSVVVPHGILLRDQMPGVEKASPSAIKSIVHTGILGSYQTEGVQRLLRILRENSVPGWQVVVATPTPPNALAGMLTEGMPVRIGTFSDDDVRKIQSEASVLVAFGNFSMHEVFGKYSATEFPTKVVEYLATGKPILIQAAPSSFLAQHARTHGYALVVEEPTANALLEGLKRLLSDEALRCSLLQAAARMLQDYFEIRKVADKFSLAAGIDRQCLVECKE